jgi:L-iditol 2-dehydrogenase
VLGARLLDEGPQLVPASLLLSGATPKPVWPQPGLRDRVDRRAETTRKEATRVSHPAKVKTDAAYPLPEHMRAWVLGDPGQLSLVDKPIPMPGRAEVLVHIDAVAICATDLEIIHHGAPAMIGGGQPFNKMFTPGHEYMGTVAALGPGVDEYRIGQRVTVEVHAGCGQCKRCREGMYTACLNYGLNYGDVDKGHRANGFTTDGGFAEYAVNNINTLIAIPDSMSDAEATLVVTAGTAMYGLTELGGLVAGEGVAVLGPGPIGLLGVAVAKALGASPVVLTGTRDNRLQIGRAIGADHVINVRNEDAVGAVRRITGGKGLDYVLECSGAPDAVNQAARMLNRGGRICLAAFPHQPVSVDIAYIVRNNIYLYGIRGEGKSATHRAEALMSQKRFDATKIHTHTFGLHELPTALRYAREHIDDAIKVVVTTRNAELARAAVPADDKSIFTESPR